MPHEDASRNGQVAAATRTRIQERRSGNLPLEFTNFVGRETEIAEVEKLLGDHRLLNLVGMPLAIELAAERVRVP
jgi:hypothetical protein